MGRSITEFEDYRTKRNIFLSQMEELHFSSFNLDKIESTELSFRGKSWERGKGGVWNSGIGLSVAGAKEDVRNALALVFVYLYLCICVFVCILARNLGIGWSVAGVEVDVSVMQLQPINSIGWSPYCSPWQPPIFRFILEVVKYVRWSPLPVKLQRQNRNNKKGWLAARTPEFSRTRLYLVTVCHSVKSSAQRILLHSSKSDN